MAEFARMLAVAAALSLCTVVVAHPTNGSGGAQSFGALFYNALYRVFDRVHSAADTGDLDAKAGAETAPTPTAAVATEEPSQRAGGSGRRAAVSEYALLVDRPSIFAYSPLDAGATERLVYDWDADVLPNYASCAYFDHSVYCVGGKSVKTWRLSHVDGSPLPPGPDLNRGVQWPGNGRMANINDQWLVTCGDFWGSSTCQVLHTNASHWVEIESEACGKQSAVAQHNGRAFVAGGWCNAGGSAKVWSLRINRTPAGNDTFQWRRHPDMNRARDQLAIASHQGYLYACGGYDVNEKSLSDCERWREAMRSWQVIASLPGTRERLQMLSVDGHLIVMGGHNNIEYQRDVFDYDEAEDAWRRLHDMPDVDWFGSTVVPAESGAEWSERAGPVAVRPPNAPAQRSSTIIPARDADLSKPKRAPQQRASNATAAEYVMLIDGPSVSVYSPLDASATEELVHDWHAVPSALACAHFDGAVHCVGDETNTTWRFSPVDGRLLPHGPDLNRDVQWPGNGRMANIDDEWLVTCGDWRSYQPNTCHVLHVNASQWVEIESAACRQQSAVAEHNGSVFVAGGQCRGHSAEVWSLRINSAPLGNDSFQWRRRPDMNTARNHLAIASHNGWLYACGGYVGFFKATSDCERWREGMHSRQVIAPLPEPRERLHMLSVDGRLIVMGGYDSVGTYKLDVFGYDQAEDTWSRLHDMPRIFWFGAAVVPAL